MYTVTLTKTFTPHHLCDMGILIGRDLGNRLMSTIPYSSVQFVQPGTLPSSGG